LSSGAGESQRQNQIGRLKIMVTREQLCAAQDHSLLGHVCPKEKVKKWCDEVIEYGFASVVLGPDNIKYAASLLESRAGIGAVIGFPQGANTTKIKIREAVDAIKNGATEIDTVINFTKVRDGDFKYVEREIAGVVNAAKDKNPKTITKFIIYMPYDFENPLAPTEEEAGIVSELIIKAGGDFIKFINYLEFLTTKFKGRAKFKWSGAPSLEKMVEAMEMGVSRFGHEMVPKWLKERPDFFK
jgi:deoxyribose-phosphate aldolase